MCVILSFFQINQETRFLVCPVSGVDIRSGIKASIIWSCGCVITSKALQAATTGAAKNREYVSSTRDAPQKSARDEGASVTVDVSCSF